MDANRKEFELKLVLGEDEIAKIADSALLAEMTHGQAIRKHLVSTYFDTPDHALAKAGVALRIRDADGVRLQTVKAGTKVSGGVSNPVENETPTTRAKPHPGAITDARLRRKLVGLVDFHALKPLFRTDIKRTAHRLVQPGVEAELAFDRGEIRAGRRSEPIAEVELELVSGDIEAFCDLATRLFGDVPVRFSDRSKAAAGYALLAGEKSRPRATSKVERPRIDPDDDAATMFSAVCGSAVGQILQNWNDVGQSDDVEFAHQLRIGLRRLRTALRIFRPEFDNEALRELERDLGELGRIVGHLRNSDVLLADIVRPALVDPENEAAAARLADLLVQRCACERQAVATTLRAPRWNRLALRLAMLPHGAGWSDCAGSGRSARQFAVAALAKCWKKVSKQARDLDALSDIERHQLRKDLKKLRYSLEFFVSLLPKTKYKNFLRRLKTLQDSFGYLNDVLLAATLPDMLTPEMRSDPAMQRLVGFILGWHRALSEHEWANVREHWNQIDKNNQFWA